MTTVSEFGDEMRAFGASEERRKQRRKVTMSGKVLSLLRANGGWLAIVQSTKSGPSDPVLSKIVPIEQLNGSARRKADRWVKFLT